MSAPRLVVCGLEPGPAVALASGALLAAFADERAVRPVLLGADLPLWRLLYGASARAPRVLDPRLRRRRRGRRAVRRLDHRRRPHRRRGRGAGARPLGGRQGVARRRRRRSRWTRRSCSSSTPASGAPRPPRPPAARALLAGGVEFAGVIVVGGDDQGAASELRRVLEETAKLPVLGWLPPQLSEQFARQYGGGQTGLRQIGPQPVKGGEAALCREAGTLPRPRGAGGRGRAARLPAGAAAPAARAAPGRRRPHARRRLGAAARAVRARRASTCSRPWASRSSPLHVGRDEALPEGAAGLFVAGLLDEEQLPAFAGNDALKAELADGRRRRPADAGAGRRRPAAAAPPRRQPRPHPRARRRAAGRGRAPRVVRAAPLRARHGGAREPVRRRARRPCTSCSTSSSSRSSRRPSPGGSASPARRARSRASCTSAASPPRSCPPCRRCPDLAAGFVAAMRLAAPDA